MFNLYIILFFIVGLNIGSFLNVLSVRMDNLNTVWNTRSHCPKCKKTLAWYDLVPLFSFIFLRGKCHYCKKPISWQYPMVELGTGLLFLLLFAKYGLSLSLLFYAIVFSLLIVVLIYDIKTQLVPEIFVWPAFFLALLLGWYFGTFGLMEMIWGAVVGGGLIGLLVYISKEKWMGAGDIKIGLILGLLLGYPLAIFGMFSAFVIGSIIGLIYVKLAGKTMTDTLPFAPFLIVSILIALIFGNAVIDWYWGMFIY